LQTIAGGDFGYHVNGPTYIFWSPPEPQEA
jgi:hypothetical protein